jgi:hypothetical protein
MKKLTAVLVLLSMLLTGCAQANQWEETAQADTVVTSKCPPVKPEKMDDYDPPEITGMPVSFTVQEGKTNFEKYKEDEFSQDSRRNPFRCIDSLEDLYKRYVDAEIRYYDTSGKSTALGGLLNFEDVNPYDEAFFEEYSLMPVYLVFGSGGYTCNIRAVTKENGTLKVRLEIGKWRGESTDAIVEELYCIEVPKEEIADCTEFKLDVYYYERWG